MRKYTSTKGSCAGAIPSDAGLGFTPSAISAYRTRGQAAGRLVNFVIWQTYWASSVMKLDIFPNLVMIADFEDENLNETNAVREEEQPNNCAWNEVPDAVLPELIPGTSLTYCPEKSVSNCTVDPIDILVQ
jgi:hypothetical protein